MTSQENSVAMNFRNVVMSYATIKNGRGHMYIYICMAVFILLPGIIWTKAWAGNEAYQVTALVPDLVPECTRYGARFGPRYGTYQMRYIYCQVWYG
jgi:hypothetical protein